MTVQFEQPETLSRRQWLRRAAAGAACARTALSGAPAIPSGSRPKSVPAHLPDRLSICYYGWDWITAAQPGEAFADLERALVETKERGYNCVRPEMGLNWMFDPTGKRRGPLQFGAWIPGASSNLHCVDAKGGGVHDVHERVMRLFELAAKHDLYIIMTEWEYQDALAFTVDAKVRDEIVGVPYNDRLMLLAQHFHRLLTDLKQRGLHRRIASVEVINELNVPRIVCAPPNTPNQTFAEWCQAKSPKPGCSTDQVRALARKAVGFLRERHSDLLVTVDGLVATVGFGTIFPENGQIADHHAYSDGVIQAFWKNAGLGSIDGAKPKDETQNPFLKEVLKPNPTSYEEIARKARHVRANWVPLAWLYSNLDNDKFDRWCVEHYPQYRQKAKESLDKQFQAAAEFAAPRNLPLVVDEGFMLYPPLQCKYPMTAEGREGEEMGVDAAIATGHWGVMLSGYFRPNTPLWRNDSQCDWARGVNRRIQRTKTHTMGA